MDPNATWLELLATLQHYAQHRCHANKVHVIDRLEALTEWLRKGGFPPQVERTFAFTEREMILFPFLLKRLNDSYVWNPDNFEQQVKNYFDMLPPANIPLPTYQEMEQLLERLGNVQ